MQPDRPDQPPRPGLRHRFAGRTRPLIALGAALGVVGGVAAGYAVQYGRPPTPLPPLAAGVAAQSPQTTGDAAARPAAAPWADGDLEMLLAPRPEGATAERDSRRQLRLDELSELYEDATGPFKRLAEGGFRRAVMDEWHRGSLTVRTILYQFRDTNTAMAARYVRTGVEQQRKWFGVDVKLSGTAAGELRVHDETAESLDGEPVYQAHALARRGGVVMEMIFQDTARVDENTAKTLTERQLDQLRKAPARTSQLTAEGTGAAALRAELLPARSGPGNGPDAGRFRDDALYGPARSVMLAAELLRPLPDGPKNAFAAALRRHGAEESAVRTYPGADQVREVQLVRLKAGGPGNGPADLAAALVGDGVREGPRVPGHPDARCVLPERPGAALTASMLCAGHAKGVLVLLTAYGPNELDTTQGARQLSRQLDRLAAHGGTA
ncbi:hypothetical protein [Streptomyces chrestomyceticus]|uniref:hypothetical protein n=1 Tax=Streptomyces chrestomyceticus TaxID=68185 RepID=UPI0033FC01AF